MIIDEPLSLLSRGTRIGPGSIADWAESIRRVRKTARRAPFVVLRILWVSVR